MGRAVRPRVTAAERARLDLVGRGTQTTNAGAPLAPQRHTAMDRGRGQPSQYWGLVCPRVRLTGTVVILADAPAVQQTRNPRFHGGQDFGHVQSGESRRRMKHQRVGAVLREDAVQHEGVDVQVQIERPTETLEHSYRTPTSVGHIVQLCTTAQPTQHRTHVKGDDRTAQVVIPRQPIQTAGVTAKPCEPTG